MRCHDITRVPMACMSIVLPLLPPLRSSSEISLVCNCRRTKVYVARKRRDRNGWSRDSRRVWQWLLRNRLIWYQKREYVVTLLRWERARGALSMAFPFLITIPFASDDISLFEERVPRTRRQDWNSIHSTRYCALTRPVFSISRFDRAAPDSTLF